MLELVVDRLGTSDFLQHCYMPLLLYILSACMLQRRVSNILVFMSNVKIANNGATIAW